MSKMPEHACHEFPAFYHEDSEILILGSFPSVKSREQGFYYGHPQNRFWSVLAACYNEDAPITIEEKKMLLQRHKIALYDSIDECDINGSSDASIENVVPTDLSPIFRRCKIRKIGLNGKKAWECFLKYQRLDEEVAHLVLPSTSAANAKFKKDDLICEWSRFLKK